MPPTLRTPGVYVEETVGARVIETAPTAVTAFVGPTPKGPFRQPFSIESWSSFENVFGGLSADLPLGHAVSQFLANGGTDALIVRIGADDRPANEEDIFDGLAALDGTPFNLLCIPPLGFDTDLSSASHKAAGEYGARRRALYVANAPLAWADADQAIRELNDLFQPSDSIALFYPRLIAPNPIDDGAQTVLPPCGAVAGVIARCDAEVGVWQAPAGLAAALRGATRPSVALNDAGNGLLNQHGVNALRAFPTHGSVVWGARTLAGSENLTSEWKYVPVRRLAWHIENCIEASLSWTVFEPNAAPLWAMIRRLVTDFMTHLWKAGALAGAQADHAFFVRCSLGQTMSTQDVEDGAVLVEIGFAPAKPAEFLILKLQLKSATGETGVL